MDFLLISRENFRGWNLFHSRAFASTSTLILIVPLIRRVVNLQQLKLYLTVYRPYDDYLDVVQLSDLLLNHLAQLRRFTFNIETTALNTIGDRPLPTNKVIQRSFTGKHYQQLVSVVYNGFNEDNSTCRIYSLPYDFYYFLDLDHSFPGGLFQKVRFLRMKDEHSFEDALFRIISHDMPYLEQLTITNKHPLKNKRCSSTILGFPRLERLDLQYAHDDYVELFLLTTKTSLPRLSILRIRNQSLQRLKSRDVNGTGGPAGPVRSVPKNIFTSIPADRKNCKFLFYFELQL